MPNRLTLSKSLCLLIVLISGIVMYFRSSYIIPHGDEVCYRYMIADCPIGTKNYELYTEESRVHDFMDLEKSMKKHYITCNGRHLIHTLLQAFVGLWNYKGYNIFISLVMMLTMILFIRYTCPKELRWNPIPYMILLIAYLYLFRLEFQRITFGLNYLLPMMLVLGWLLGQRYLRENDNRLSTIRMFGLILLSIVTGWSHEGYSIPLSGGVVLYSIFNIKRIRRKEWIYFVALWLGTLILFASPANFARVGSETVGDRFHRFIQLALFGKMAIIWISALFIILFLMFVKFRTLLILKAHFLPSITLILSLFFSTIANTGVWSLVPLDFYALIIAFILFFSLNYTKFTHHTSVWLFTSLIFLLGISAHQFIIVKSEYNLKDLYDKEYTEYLISSDNYFKVTPEPIPAVANPWVSNWQDLDYVDREYMQFTLGICKQANCKFIGEKDYQALYDPDVFFVKDNLIPGSGRVYQGNYYLWIKKGDYIPVQRYVLHYGKARPSDAPYFLLAVKAWLTPEALSDTEVLQSNTILQDNVNDSTIAFPILQSMWRHIDSISAGIE